MTFVGTESMREHLVSFGARFVPRTVLCDGEKISFSDTEPTPLACGGIGRHVLTVDYAPRPP